MIKPKSDLCKAFIYYDVERKKNCEVRATAKEIVVYFRESQIFRLSEDSFVIQILISNTTPTKTEQNVERKAANLLAQKQRSRARRQARADVYPVNHVFTKKKNAKNLTNM